MGVLFCIDRSIDRLNGGGFERGFAVSQRTRTVFLFISIDRKTIDTQKTIDEKKKKLTTCAHGTSSSVITFTLLLLDLPRFCAVQIRLLAVQQQARLLVIVFVFVLGDAVFDLFPRGTIWTRASVVTSRVRRRFDVLLTVFPPLVPVVVADHGVRWRVEKEPRSSLPLLVPEFVFFFEETTVHPVLLLLLLSLLLLSCSSSKYLFLRLLFVRTKMSF